MKARSVLAIFHYIVAVVALIGAGFQSAHAQSNPYEVKADGTQYSITLGPSQRGLSKLSVFMKSSGNISTAVTVNLQGPVGIKVSARGGFVGSADPATVLYNPSLAQQYKMREKNDSEKDVYTLPADYAQDGVTTGLAWFHLTKDACSGNNSSLYAAQVDLDLSGIDQSLYDKTFPITLALKEFEYKGTTASSIKPSSDGMYRGEPIILMSSIQYGSEYFKINRWSGGRLVSSRKLPVAKYAYWRGYALALGRLKGFLTGGKATFELTNGGDIYPACFTLQRRRQTANGYPG